MSSGIQRVSPHRGVHEETPHMQLPNPPPIYLDYHATTPVDPRVAAVIVHTMTTAFGNANSVEHVYGEVAAALMTDARHEVAALAHADPEGVHFTSGSSEMSLSRLSHGLPWAQAHPEVVQGTTEFHDQIADAFFPQADAVFHDVTPLNTTIDMLDPQSTLVKRLVGPLLLRRKFLAAGFLSRHEHLHLGQRAR